MIAKFVDPYCLDLIYKCITSFKEKKEQFFCLFQILQVGNRIPDMKKKYALVKWKKGENWDQVNFKLLYY